MFRSLLLGIAVLGSLSVFGAVVPSEEKTTALVPSPSEGKIIGLVDLRPSDVFKGEDTFRMENSAELGYRFNPKLQLTYKQEIWGNLVQPSLSASPNNFFVRDGWVDVLCDKVFVNEDQSLFFTYEGRAYLPTFETRRNAGMVTAVRNYATVGKKPTGWMTVSATETPIAHFYSQDSYLGKANPVFENRFQLKAGINLTSKLSLSLPLIWQATKMRLSQGASKSGIWDNYVWINPEIFYAVDPHLVMGLGYYDVGSLMKNDLSDTQIGDGLRDGVVQMIFKAML
jgi:hypothetical protein